MAIQQVIFKERVIDIPATAMQLGIHDECEIAYSTMKVSAIRTAISRLNKTSDARYSVKETVNGSIIRRIL